MSYTAPPVVTRDDVIISVPSILADGFAVSASPLSGPWPAANLAFYLPFRISRTLTVYKMAWNNGTSAGNTHDIGIYDAAGTTKLVSSGATTGSGISSDQIIDVADTTLSPGMYWLAYMHSTTTANRVRLWTTSSSTAGLAVVSGAREEALGASVLPSSISLSTYWSRTNFPHLWFETRAAY